MEVKIEVKLQPFKVPNYVLTEVKAKSREDGYQEAPKYALNEISSEALLMLCEQFTHDVFKKAGKEKPPLG